MPAQDYEKMNVEELEAQVKRRALLLHLKLTESLSYDANFIDPREPLYDEASFWTPLSGAMPGNLNNQGRGEHLPIYLNALGLKEVRDQSRWMCAYNEFAINAINNHIAYVVGTGLKYKVVRREDDPATPHDDKGKQDFLTERAQAVLDQFIDDNDWHELEAEIVRRCDRDGECFLRFFIAEDGLTVRVIEPEFVAEQGGDARNSFGIITDEDDVQTVHGYSVMEHPGKGSAPVFVPVHEILHIKACGSDRTHKRGLPILFPVRKNLERVEKLLRNMSVLAQVQSTYAVIRKHTGVSAAAIRNYATELTDTSYQDRGTGRTQNIAKLQPGSIVDTTANSEYEFPSASVNAAAYVEIIQADLRAVASCLGFPEFMVSSKSDGVNFASALVAEAPHIKQMERLQKYYARKFGEGCFRRTQHQPVMWRVLVMAIRLGALPREVLTACEIQVECPRLTTRDKSGDTNRLATLNQAGVVSKTTWAALEDLDYEQEQRNGAKEEEGKDRRVGEPDEGGDDPSKQDAQSGDKGEADGEPSDEELDALLAQLQSGADGALPSQETVGGEQRPESGLERGKRPGTVSESLHEAETASAPASDGALTPHRKTQDITRDNEGNMTRIVTTIEPLASTTPSLNGAAE